jgi:hypothetical protein
MIYSEKQFAVWKKDLQRGKNTFSSPALQDVIQLACTLFQSSASDHSVYAPVQALDTKDSEPVLHCPKHTHA